MPATITIADRVRKLIGEHLAYFDDGQNVARTANDEDSLKEDLGADSLDVIEITMALEEEFNIEITDDEAEAWRTVGDVVRCIEGKRHG